MLNARRGLFFLLVIAACRTPQGAQPVGPAGGGGDAQIQPAGDGTAPAPVATPSGPARKVVSIEGITEYQLDNGLRIVLFPDTSKQRVTVNVTYMVGSRHEGYGETGMAHLLEHMLFKGTKTHTNPWADLERHGAAFNGSTWTDRTNYYETMPAGDENLEWALRFEADRMVNSLIAPEVLAKEFSVVRNEFEAGENQPLSVLSERIWSTAFLWHNYGKSTIGSRSDIERVPAHRLRAFYEKFYQPDNAILIVAGNFDEAKTLGWIQKYYGSLPRPTRKLEATYTIEPLQDGERNVILRRVGDVGAVGVAYHSVAGGHPDFVASEALADILTEEPSGRLYKALVETGMASSVWASVLGFNDPGLFEITASVRQDKPLEPVRDKMISIIEGIAAGKLTDAEVNRFKNKTLKQFELNLTDSNRIAVELSEWAAQGDWRLLFVYRDRVEALDKDQVQKFAASYLKQANRTVGLFIPTKAPERSPLPETPNVASVVKDYKGRDAMSAGEAFEATVANVEKRTTRTQLPNGLKVAYLAKKTRGAAVRVVFRLHFGTEKDLTGKTTAAALVGQMVMRGTKKKTYQQIKDEFDRLKANVRFGGGGSSENSGGASVVIDTTRDNLPEVLALVGECLKEPSFPKSEFEILRKEHLAELEQQLTDPNAMANEALSRRLSPYKPTDIRYVPSTKEEIERLKAVKLDELKRIHKDFWGAGAAEMAIVGDFDDATTKKAVETHFGAWKAPKPFKRVEMTYVDAPAAEDSIDTPDKEMAMVMLGHNLQVRDDDPDYPALEMINHVMGGAADSRLFNRLRQKEGWSYGTWSAIYADAQDTVGGVIAGAICAPQNADKALAAMQEEIQNLLAKGVSADELAKAKKSYQLAFDNLLANDRYVSSLLAGNMHVGRTFEYQKQLNDAVAKLTPEDLMRVMKKHLKPEKFVKVKAGDFKKAKANAAPSATK